MKQVKNHNDLIYYTKFKLSWATLNTIQPHPPKNMKTFLKFWFVKMTSFDHNPCFIDSQHSIV